MVDNYFLNFLNKLKTTSATIEVCIFPKSLLIYHVATIGLLVIWKNLSYHGPCYEAWKMRQLTLNAVR